MRVGIWSVFFFLLLCSQCLEHCLEYFSDAGLNKSLLKELPVHTIISDGWTLWAMMI